MEYCSKPVSNDGVRWRYTQGCIINAALLGAYCMVTRRFYFSSDIIVALLMNIFKDITLVLYLNQNGNLRQPDIKLLYV